MPARDDIPRLREPVEATLARMDEALGAIREDVSEIKANQGQFDHRVAYLEDVRVRAIEDRAVRNQAIADERKRSADAAAQHAQTAAQSASASAAEAQTRQLKITWKLATLIGIAIVVATIVGDLIGHVL